MDNNSSNSSVCRKIRRALASNRAVRAVQGITSFNQEPKPVTKYPNSPSSTTNISTQSKPAAPHRKAHTEGSGAIPIKLDHSTPRLSGNGYSAVSTKGASSERAIKVAAKGEPHPKHVAMQGKQHGHGVHSEPQGNDHFKEFIQRTREKMMKSVSNIGWTHSNPVPAPDQEAHAHGTNKNENHFSEFIQRARKKLRTTTTVRKSGSLKKE
ncbi:hypothetical protein E2542_SST24110 [Spatholobus suberectus]|nr:hypothetical protein E2542_SST24110 [Spatholobus suberectus]